eukprot:g1436.t1
MSEGNSTTTGKKVFKCRRRGCNGVLTNIGTEPLGREDLTPRDLERSREIAKKEIRTELRHGYHFSCSECGETPVVPKKKVVRAWHRYCAVCDNVFATNSFFSEHGGQGRRSIKHNTELKKRSARHKRKLVSMLMSIRSKKENQENDMLLELPTEHRWLITATKGPLGEEKSKKVLERSIETFVCPDLVLNSGSKKKKKQIRKSPKGDVTESLSKLSLVSPGSSSEKKGESKEKKRKIVEHFDEIQPVDLLSEFQSITLDPIDKDIAQLFNTLVEAEDK